MIRLSRPQLGSCSTASSSSRTANLSATHPRLAPHRAKSTLTLIPPSPSAPRHAPTPIVFLAVPSFSDAAAAGHSPSTRTSQSLWSPWISHATSRGYESLLLDVDPDELHDVSSPPPALKVLDLLEKEMSSSLRLASTFPPILFARGYDSVAAEQYAGSHGLSALFLLDPAVSFSEDAQGSQGPKLLLRGDKEGVREEEASFEFNFEPRFPCRVAWSRARIDALSSLGEGEAGEAQVPLHRIEEELIEEEEQEGRIVWEDADREEVIEETIGGWLEDECGLGPQGEEHTNTDKEQLVDNSEAAADPDSNQSSSIWHDPTTGGYPTWFLTGTYTFASDGNKRLPLLLDETHLREEFRRGSGKGGQAINKNRSRCDLLHIPTGTIVRCQETRSLERNRVIARRRLSRVLEEGLRGGESVKGRERERERRRKNNKVKKQMRRKREAEAGEEADDGELA